VATFDTFGSSAGRRFGTVNLGFRRQKQRFRGKLCHLTSDFSGAISEAIAPEKNFQDFPKKVLMRFRVSR
jgi:hypothetical protein